MQYRTLGTNKVSVLGFGCMRLPTVDGGTNRAIDADINKTHPLIMESFERGINYFDTAYNYHNFSSELALGEALKKEKLRNKIFLATKLNQMFFDKPDKFEQAFNEQLEKLKTDYFDYYLVHNLSSSRYKIFKENGGLDFIEALKKQGKVQHIGFSFHDDYSAFPTIVDGFDWDFCQIQYNYMDINFQAGTKGLEYASSKGLDVVIMEPLKGGSLTKTPPNDIQEIWNKTGRNYSPAEWGLRFLFDNPKISCVLSGMNELSQIEENCRVADEHLANTLTQDDFAAIAEVKKIFDSRNKVECTGCAYCMPCQFGVNIPNVFQIYNSFSLFNDTFWANTLYNINLKSIDDRADKCTECGACVELCPQNINIPEELKNAHECLSALAK